MAQICVLAPLTPTVVQTLLLTKPVLIHVGGSGEGTQYFICVTPVPITAFIPLFHLLPTPTLCS